MRSNITPNRRNPDPSPLQDSFEQNNPRQDLLVSQSNGYTEFFSWGNDEDGQLGHGQESPNRKKIFNLPKSLSFEVLISQVSCGFSHTAFISKQGYVFTFGSNSDGQLGVNDQSIKFSTAPLLVSELIAIQATPVTLSCGGFHTGVTTTVGEVYLWGRNIQGQCGRSATYNQFLFNPQKLHIESLKQFKDIDCGDLHTALISTTGELYTLGDNSEGQLGIGMEYKIHTDRPTLVTGITEEVTQVSCGNRHTLVLTDHGTVYGMGTNRKFELGLLNNQPTLAKCITPVRIQALEIYMVVKVQAGGFSVALTSQNEILVWGTGEFGQFQTPQKIYMDDTRFIDVSLSKSTDSFAAAVDQDGFIYTWGQNQFGQLGLGDFRFRKLPTKVPQLRKKKIRNIACGGAFIVALGKDVPDGQQKTKKKKSDEIAEPTSLSQRSKSQVTFGNQSSSLRRKQQLDKPLTESQLKSSTHSTHQRQSINLQKSDSRQNQSFEQKSPSLGQNSQPAGTYQMFQPPENNKSNLELSVERQKRYQLEKDLKDKEYELLSLKQSKAQLADNQMQVSSYKRDNEILRDALEKEQENSYKLLKDIHKHIADNKAFKEQLEDKQRESRSLQQENKRQIERAREVELENDKLKQEQSYLVQRSEGEIQKMKVYIDECEQTINEQRDRMREIEKAIINKQDQQRVVEMSSDKLKIENGDLKRQILAFQERIKQLEYQVNTQQKENDDLKYDNTLLYEKNVEKDDKLIKVSEEIDQLKVIIDSERNRTFNLDKDSRRYVQKTAQLEEQLNMEREKVQQRERTLDDLINEREQMRKDLENQISEKCVEYDNLKRAFDEQQYDNENLRRMLNSKQEEMGQLNKIIAQQSQNSSELIDKIKELENTIRDVEEKNKKLVDLLNSNMYTRAEQYKERVINKLQERNPITPGKSVSITNPSPQLQMNTETNEYKQGEPSPIRLQKILSDEKDQLHKDRERLLRAAENLTKGYDQPTLNQMPSFQDEQSFKGLFISPYQRNEESRYAMQEEPAVDTSYQSSKPLNTSQYNPRRNMQPQLQDQQRADPGARLRMSDIQTPNKFSGSGIIQDNQNNSMRIPQETSPDRIAEILRQQSPLRKKLAVEALQQQRPQSKLDYTPNKSGVMLNDSKLTDEDTTAGGGLVSSKITHTLISNELNELKNRVHMMQREKTDLEQRLHNYESNKSRLDL